MPVLDPKVVDKFINNKTFARRLNDLVKEKQEVSDLFEQDFFANYLKNEYGIMSLLRRSGIEPSFLLTKGRFGEDAEALGSRVKSIEIKSNSHKKAKKWKLPDIINNSSHVVIFDKIRQRGSIAKIRKYDGYAFGIFMENLNYPDWVTINNYEPILLMWIKNSGAKKVTKLLLKKIAKRKRQLKRDNVDHDNSFSNNTVQPTFKEVFELLPDRDLYLIVNGVRLTKFQYKQALKKGDEFWNKKGLPCD